LSLSVSSTCIVIYHYGNAFYVGADSRSTMDDGTYKSICKIHHSGTCYYAISGYDDQRLYVVAHNSLLKNGLVQDIIQSFAVEMKKQYTGLMQYVKQHNPKKYSFYCDNKNALGTVVFFGFDQQGEPYTISVEFDMVNNFNQNPTIKESIDEGFEFLALGMTDHINKYPESELCKILKSDSLHIEKGIERLIKSEIGKHKDKIGYPIDLLKLTKSGPTWIRKKQQCD